MSDHHLSCRSSLNGIQHQSEWHLVGFAGSPLEDHSDWYRVAVSPADVPALRDHVKATARRFGQRCLYFQRSGEAELVWADQV